MGTTTIDSLAKALPPGATEADARRGAPASPPVRDRLLLAVAQALKALLGAGELRDNIGHALQLLGEAAQMHRVKVILDQPERAGRAAFHALTYEWWAPGFASQTSLGVVVFPNASISEYLLPLQRGQSFWQLIDEVSASLRAPFEHVGMRSMGVVPIFAKDRYAGLVAFDDCVEKRRWTEAEIEALTIAARAIGAVIEREAAEKERESEARRLQCLLQAVNEASRALLAGSDFDAGVRAGMALLGSALNVIRVGLVQDLPLPLDDAPGRWRITHEWAADGVPAQLGSAAETGEYPSPAVWQRLRAGETAIVRIDDADAAFAEGQRAIRTQSILTVPLFVDDRWWGLLAFDQAHDHDWAEHELAVLNTAAACVSAALTEATKRQEALQALLAERERSAHERAAELAQANASMRRTLARLAAAEDVDAFLATALLELRQQAGAEEAFLFAAGDQARDGSSDSLLRLRGSVRADGFQRQSHAGDPPIFTIGFMPTPQAMAAMRHGSWLLWRPVAAGEPLPPRQPEVQRWLLQRGIAADACCLLQVGERCVGLVVLHLASAQPLPSSRCELLVALSQPMALALELGRMARAAQQAAQDRAVLAERNRMARDVHDTLAQGFTAISLQLQAAARADSADDRARFVARATQEAQANLVESRRTIRLLRGLADPDEATHGLVHVIEDALASRLSGTALAWRVLPLPPGVAEPRLDDDTRREIKRIAQEAATNALKHASASLFEARLGMQPDGSLCLRLEDQGRGFDPQAARDGFGILGMRERAERIGAALHVESRPGGPTAVVVQVPPRAAAQGSA